MLNLVLKGSLVPIYVSYESIMCIRDVVSDFFLVEGHVALYEDGVRFRSFGVRGGLLLRAPVYFGRCRAETSLPPPLV